MNQPQKEQTMARRLIVQSSATNLKNGGTPKLQSRISMKRINPIL